MDMNALAPLITSVGFPIVACVGMFYYLTKVMEKRDEKMDKTIDELTKVVNENNKLIAVLSTLIKRKYGEDDGED